MIMAFRTISMVKCLILYFIVAMEFIITVRGGLNDNKMIVIYLIHIHCDYRMRKLKKLEHELRRSNQQIAQNSSILISSSINLNMFMMMLFVPMIQYNMNDQFYL